MIDPEVEALITDRYLDALMIAADRRALDAPSDLLDPALRRTARRLAEDLVRVHPSFRFEERLAARLAAAAEAMARQGAAAASVDRVASSAGAAAVSATGVVALPPALREVVAAGGAPVFGSTIASAALTSAALSIGAAVVAIAWRRGHLPRRPGRTARQEARA